jgi:hypothetical protein
MPHARSVVYHTPGSGSLGGQLVCTYAVYNHIGSWTNDKWENAYPGRRRFAFGSRFHVTSPYPTEVNRSVTSAWLEMEHTRAEYPTTNLFRNFSVPLLLLRYNYSAQQVLGTLFFLKVNRVPLLWFGQVEQCLRPRPDGRDDGKFCRRGSVRFPRFCWWTHASCNGPRDQVRTTRRNVRCVSKIGTDLKTPWNSRNVLKI